MQSGFKWEGSAKVAITLTVATLNHLPSAITSTIIISWLKNIYLYKFLFEDMPDMIFFWLLQWLPQRKKVPDLKSIWFPSVWCLHVLPVSVRVLSGYSDFLLHFKDIHGF